MNAVIDTGCSGALALPPELVAELPHGFSCKATLADDTEVSFRVHRLTTPWDGEPRHIDVVHGGSVVVQARE